MLGRRRTGRGRDVGQPVRPAGNLSLRTSGGKIHVGNFLGGVAAIVIGVGLGAATVVGVVQSNSTDDDPIQPATSVVDYGSND
ncbi:DUF2613 family protein [Mumia zhuanghuii]|uniref:DUF2613 family protein n=1 Tax=Mumia zhuanghuii TaxID=2585211 RepID=A0A5C4MFA2_9ACTN|nr:DUF2613 family protein [Mumia zhuanghuii]